MAGGDGLAMAEASGATCGEVRTAHLPGMRRVALIVPAFNEAEGLPPVLEALQAARAALADWESELIVVDNNSTDATAAVAAAGGARVVFEPHNQIARARNAGAAAAREPDALVFIDADTRLTPALLQEALFALRAGDCAGGGALLRFDRALTPLGRACVAGWTSLSRRFRWAAGSFVFVRADAFADIGGFSERFYAGEEIDFSRRLRRWARRHGHDTRILESSPVITSARKFTWHSPWKVAAVHLLLGLFPFLVLSRRSCRFWYERPS
jgi:glycosyltransferase involved in cell wall biosynthesis